MSSARRIDQALVSTDGRYVWNGQRWVPSFAEARSFNLGHVPNGADRPHQGAGFLPAWLMLLLGLIVGLAFVWFFDPAIFRG